jgi:hypothetical protein
MPNGAPYRKKKGGNSKKSAKKRWFYTKNGGGGLYFGTLLAPRKQFLRPQTFFLSSNFVLWRLL